MDWGGGSGECDVITWTRNGGGSGGCDVITSTRSGGREGCNVTTWQARPRKGMSSGGGRGGGVTLKCGRCRGRRVVDVIMWTGGGVITASRSDPLAGQQVITAMLAAST